MLGKLATNIFSQGESMMGHFANLSCAGFRGPTPAIKDSPAAKVAASLPLSSELAKVLYGGWKALKYAVAILCLTPLMPFAAAAWLCFWLRFEEDNTENKSDYAR